MQRKFEVYLTRSLEVRQFHHEVTSQPNELMGSSKIEVWIKEVPISRSCESSTLKSILLRVLDQSSKGSLHFSKTKFTKPGLKSCWTRSSKLYYKSRGAKEVAILISTQIVKGSWASIEVRQKPFSHARSKFTSPMKFTSLRSPAYILERKKCSTSCGGMYSSRPDNW